MIPVGILTAAATSSFSFLLDLYPGAAAAYSFRKLRSAYTGFCIRVISSGVGNPTLDIGFVNNILDITTLQTFVGANTGRILTWYDQSGNGNNATQSNIANSCIIINSGVLITDGSQVAIIGNQFYSLSTPITPNTSYAGFSVMSRTSSTGFMTSFSGAVLPIITLSYSDGNLYNYNKVTEIKYSFNLTGRFLFSTLNVVNVQSAYRNGAIQTVITTSVPGTGNIDQLMGRSAVEGFQGKTQEHILYNIDQSANNTGINANINAYYTIY
jgi:hypothetical protein